MKTFGYTKLFCIYMFRLMYTYFCLKNLAISRASSVELSEKKSLGKNCEKLQSLFRNAYFIAKESMAFLKYKKIFELQQLNGMSVGNTYLSNNACKRFIASIATDLKDDTKSDFNSARFVTIMSDGFTDKG